jgi:SAM-dependent methyltransferase
MRGLAAVARAENIAIAASERLWWPARRSCSCCGWQGLSFRTLAVAGYLRHGAVCPRCGSFERHRALAGFYPQYFAQRGMRPVRLVHCAPEPFLRPLLSSLCERYETNGYGESYEADHQFDLRRITLPDGSCDAFVMNHVLDCMDDDEAAAHEMWRVLRPGGVILATVTFDPGIDTTPQRRDNGLRRIYGGHDVARRFASFEVQMLNAAEWVSDVTRAGVPANVPVLVLCKVGG